MGLFSIAFPADRVAALIILRTGPMAFQRVTWRRI
jgi:hypothetical protein